MAPAKQALGLDRQLGLRPDFALHRVRCANQQIHIAPTGLVIDP